MLVTKREVKQASKKFLSLLLSVLMIVSTISVCFGTFGIAASAANLNGDYSSYTADPLEYLSTALKSDTITWIGNTYNIGNTENEGEANNTNNVTYVTDVKLNTYAEYVEVRDILIYLDKAIKGTECYQVGTADKDDEQTKSCVSAGDVEAEILDGLSSYGTVTTQAKEFIAFVLEDERAVQHSAASDSDKSPALHTATLNVYTEDYKGYLDEFQGKYSDVPDKIEMGHTYTMTMKGALYYSVQGTCGATNYYHNAIWPSEYPINAPSAYTYNESVKTTLANYASEINTTIANNSFDVMASKTLAEIEALKSNLSIETNTIKAYIADEGEGKQDTIYNELFPGLASEIAAFNETADKAEEIAAYTETVAEITAYQTNNPDYGVFSWGGFDEVAIKAAYNDFMNTYGAIINDATLYDYFTKNGSISDTYVKNFRDNVVAYNLQDLKEEKIEPLYNRYALSFPMEGEEETITLAEKQAVYSELSGYINNIGSYSQQVQDAIFPETINHLLDFQEKLECQVADCVLYFAENVSKDYSNVATDAVIAEIATAKSNLAALNTLLNSVDYAENTALLDSAFANAETFIEYLYTLLGERYTAQVEIVDSTYTAIERPNSNLTIKQYSQLNAYVNGIEPEIVSFLDSEGKGALVTAETRAKYAAIETELLPAFNAFEIDRGFNNYSPEDVLIRREDSSEEIFRQNADLDDDGVGEYEVTDENVNAIVDLLEEALKDPTVASLLGDLINKDENGNPTGEAFSLADLVTGLLEDKVYTDSLINTIMQFVYPLVLKEFAKVWAGLAPTITVTVPDVVGSLDADVDCGLALDDVETAIASVGLYIAPTTLAANLRKNFPQYSQPASVLETATSKAKYDKVTDTFRNPWENVNLFTDVLDEDGNPVLNDDGTVKTAYNLNWGVDEAENKKEAFVNAAVAALSGLEPLLMAIISNKHFTNPDVTDAGEVRGVRIGYGSGTATVTVITVKVTIDPITLTLDFAENDGWDNALAPIFEALGLTNIPHSEDLQTTRKLIEDGLLAMIDQLVAKLDANPVEFLLDALPNLCYALEGGLVEPLLHELKTVINYYADAYYDASVTTGTLKDAMTSEEPININIGEMINLKDMGLDISNFNAIWNMLSGVELLQGVEAPDAAYIASLGTLVEKETNRSTKTYTAGTANKAYHINANRADVLQYLVKWVLESGLLGGIVENPSETVATIFANLQGNSTDAIAAIVELLNQQAYPAKNYTWFNGTVGGESVVGNSANEIYLNPGNDWTEEKAEFLYNNLESIITAVLTMAGKELNLEALLSEKVGALLSDKTLTALAGLLAKLDLNELLNKDKTEEEKAEALDVNALVNSYLGLDLAAIAAQYAPIAAELETNPEYVYNFGVDSKEKTFAAALTEMLAPLSVVLDFILEGGNITITIGGETVTLLGAEGYNNAIIPLLEALGCDAKALSDGEDALTATVNALVAKIEALTTNEEGKNDGAIYGIIDMLPGLLYFISSGALSTTILNLLQPVFVIIDTIKPVYDLDLNAIINNIEALKSKGIEIDIMNLDTAFVMNLVSGLTGLDLSTLANVIYDICNVTGKTYTSASTLQTNWKKGVYNENFTQADMLTVLLSFVLEWATVEDNAKALDEMLKTDGIIAAIGNVFADVKISYNTPNWYYWLETEEEFNDYLAGNTELPNTLVALTYPNDWSEESAQYIADNLSSLVDMVISLIEIDGTKYDSVKALVESLIGGYISADTVNMLLDMLKDVLANVDDALLSVGYILDVDLVGLKNYTCEKEITTVRELTAELAYVLDTYAKGLVDLLFFGDDFRIAKKSDNSDTIVINGGLGYEKGLALILEALDCDVPDAEDATVYTVLDALGARVEAILESPVNEVIDMLPNLVYFLNANGASVAIDNLLQPVYALLEKINSLKLFNELDLADLLGFDLKYLSLADILALVESKTGLDLSAAEETLVDLCIGKIEKAMFTYKMTADRKDTITVILTTALLLVSDEDFAAKLEEMLGTDVISAIKEVFESAPVTYSTPDWYALDGSDIDYDNATVGVIEYAITYPNNWTEESAKYLADNLTSIGNMVAGIIDSNYATLGALVADKVNIYTPDTLKAIQNLLGNLIGGLDEDLKEIVNVGLGAADALLDADVNALLAYDVSGVKDKETFVTALTGMLMEVEGLVDWLLLGEDYNFFVDNNSNDIITLNGGHGYAEGLALVLEALGVTGLPTVYNVEGEIDTQAVVSEVLTATFNRVDAILADPVTEVFELLPNVIYFINSNGLTVAVENLLGAINALLIKVEPIIGKEIDIASLVNFSEILNVETTLALNNITMEAVVDLVAELTGLNLDKIADVLVGFALGRVQVYESVSNELAYKMYYHDDFAKYDMITVLATVAIITLTDDANAESVKALLGEDVYQVILNLINMGDVPVQEFNWLFTSEETGGNKVGETFTTAVSSELYEDYIYGTLYTVEMAEYIANDFGTFVDNILYLLGLEIDGVSVENLTELTNGLLNGSVYNSENVIAIRDALAGVLANLTNLEVNGAVVGTHIAEILRTTGIADIAAVATVEVPEFGGEDNAKELFVKYLCDVLAPLNGILKYLLADEDLTFFVNENKTDAITLKGAEGYAYGIIPLLEALDCQDILTQAEYYDAVAADENALLTAILNPLLNRVDEIVAAPADEILAILPNLIYFINSNGVDTVVKNTLNAVYALLGAIEPIAKIDLYALIGVDLAVIDFEWLVNKLLDVLASIGYEFEYEEINAIAELTVGTLTEYTSKNGKTAYKMVYAADKTLQGGKEELVTVVLRLLVKFIMHENNQQILVDLLEEQLGLAPEAKEYLLGVLKAMAECVVDTQLGMDAALAMLYYLFYGLDTGVDGAAGGVKDLNALWKEALAELKAESNAAYELIEEILGYDIFSDVIDTEEIAPNGFINFFKKIIDWFKSIMAWFRNAFAN